MPNPEKYKNRKKGENEISQYTDAGTGNSQRAASAKPGVSAQNDNQSASRAGSGSPVRQTDTNTGGYQRTGVPGPQSAENKARNETSSGQSPRGAIDDTPNRLGGSGGKSGQAPLPTARETFLANLGKGGVFDKGSTYYQYLQEYVKARERERSGGASVSFDENQVRAENQKLNPLEMVGATGEAFFRHRQR